MATLITPGEALLLLTLLEPVRLPPTLPPGFDSLDAPCPGQEAPRSLRQQGSWIHQAGEEPVDIMFLPRNGKVGMILGKDQSSGTSMPGNSHTPLPAAQSLALPCWAPWSGRHIAEVARAALGPWYICPHTYRVYDLTYSQIFP